MDTSRNLRRAVFAALACGAIAGCTLATLSPSAAPPATTVATAEAPSASPSATVPPTSSPSTAPKTAMPSGSPSSAKYPDVPVPADKLHEIPLPAGMDLENAFDPEYPGIAADGDWLVTQFPFKDLPPGRDHQLYAIDIVTGASRRLADHQADGSVANGRAAWVDPICKYYVPGKWSGVLPDQTPVCTSWKLHLMDLATGADQVVASGAISESVSDALLSYGDQERVIPTAALSSGTLAYTTGDLKNGFTLHLLSISSGTERTVGLGGMIQEMHWAGSDLVWIEDTGLHHDKGGPQSGALSWYYTGTRLMLLPAGAGEASAIGSRATSLVADSTGIVWGQYLEFFRASGPDWTSVSWGVLPSLAVTVSNGWAAWFDSTFNSTTDDPRVWVATYLVMRPQDSVPHVVRHGCDMSGGWIFLASRDPETNRPTGLEAVRIADLG